MIRKRGNSNDDEDGLRRRRTQRRRVASDNGGFGGSADGSPALKPRVDKKEPYGKRYGISRRTR